MSRTLPVPKISVIVDVRDDAGGLQRALESVRRQRFTDCEVVIVDDRTADRSYDVVSSYASSDPRFRLVRLQSSGGGRGRLLNEALNAAAGEYVTFLDSDGELPPRALSLLASAVESTDAQVVSAPIEQFLSDTGKASRHLSEYFARPGVFTGSSDRSDLFCDTALHAKLIQRGFLGSLRFAEDSTREEQLFVAQLWEKEPTVAVIDEVAYRHHVLGGQSSTSERPQRDIDTSEVADEQVQPVAHRDAASAVATPSDVKRRDPRQEPVPPDFLVTSVRRVWRGRMRVSGRVHFPTQAHEGVGPWLLLARDRRTGRTFRVAEVKARRGKFTVDLTRAADLAPRQSLELVVGTASDGGSPLAPVRVRKGTDISQMSPRAATTEEGVLILGPRQLRVAKRSTAGRSFPSYPAREVVLHVGPHKTGTTYLQAQLVHHRARLERFGIQYPKPPGKLPGHWQLADSFRGNLKSGPFDFDDFIGSLTQDRIVLSAEDFSLLGERELEEIRSIFPQARFRVVYYYRSPVDVIPSFWQESIKHGNASSFPQYLQELSRQIPSTMPPYFADVDSVLPYRQIPKFVNVFGFDSILLMNYEIGKEMAGGLLEQFVRGVLDIDQSKFPAKDQRVNPRRPPEIIELIRLLNQKRSLAIGEDAGPLMRRRVLSNLNDLMTSPDFLTFQAGFEKAARSVDLTESDALCRFSTEMLINEYSGCFPDGTVPVVDSARRSSTRAVDEGWQDGSMAGGAVQSIYERLGHLSR